jgi:hypothetical protein
MSGEDLRPLGEAQANHNDSKWSGRIPEMSSVIQKSKEVGEGTGRLVDQHPLPSALTAFGAGLGVGLLAVALLPNASRQRDAAITKRVLDALSGILPDSFTKRAS